MAKTLKELNPGKSYQQIREGLNAAIKTAVGFSLELLDENIEETNTNAQEIQQAKQSVTDLADRFELLDANRLAAYPEDPSELPEPEGLQEVRAIAEAKADTLNTDFNVLTHASNVYTLDYDPKQPLYWIDQTANATVQLDSMSKLTNAEVWLYVQKQPGGVTLNFRHKTKVLGVRLIGNPSTDNGAVDVYTIWKGKTRFYIDQQSKGLGTEQAPDAPTLEYVHNFTATQLPDENGKKVVRININQHPLTSVKYKVIRNESPTATSPTITETTNYANVNNRKDYGASAGNETTVLQPGKIYYRVKISLAGYEDVWYNAEITIV